MKKTFLIAYFLLQILNIYSMENHLEEKLSLNRLIKCSDAHKNSLLSLLDDQLKATRKEILSQSSAQPELDELAFYLDSLKRTGSQDPLILFNYLHAVIQPFKKMQFDLCLTDEGYNEIKRMHLTFNGPAEEYADISLLFYYGLAYQCNTLYTTIIQEWFSKATIASLQEYKNEQTCINALQSKYSIFKNVIIKSMIDSLKEDPSSIELLLENALFDKSSVLYFMTTLTLEHEEYLCCKRLYDLFSHLSSYHAAFHEYIH